MTIPVVARGGVLSRTVHNTELLLTRNVLVTEGLIFSLFFSGTRGLMTVVCKYFSELHVVVAIGGAALIAESADSIGGAPLIAESADVLVVGSNTGGIGP